MGKNKVKYGLKNVHYAPIFEAEGDIVTYGTPKHIPGAVNLSLDAAGDSEQFYADDATYFEESTNNGYEGSLEMALIPDEFRVDILGDTVDGNGALIENADAKTKKFALLFEFDGDAKKTRHVLYRVIPTRPNLESETRTGTKEPKTDSMDITARPAIDTRDVKAKITQDTTGYDNFFSAVYLKDAPANSVAIGTLTFSKADPADVEIDVTSTVATNAAKNAYLSGAPIPGVHLTVSGVDVTISEAYLTALDNGAYSVMLEFNKGNAVTVTINVTA